MITVLELVSLRTLHWIWAGVEVTAYNDTRIEAICRVDANVPITAVCQSRPIGET